jgi:uncharacterized protein Smg (DUF494 family)
MKHSLTKLVDVILRRLEEQPESSHNESVMRTWLMRQGYNQREIDAALRLVRPRLVANAPVQLRGPFSVRVLAPDEERFLTAEARDALARLDMYGLITPFEREMILERLNSVEGEVGIDELDYLLSWVVYSARDVETQQTIFGLLDGKPRKHH